MVLTEVERVTLQRLVWRRSAGQAAATFRASLALAPLYLFSTSR